MEALITCCYATRTEKCECCGKEVKNGFLFGWGVFVCSEECANNWEKENDV